MKLIFLGCQRFAGKLPEVCQKITQSILEVVGRLRGSCPESSHKVGSINISPEGLYKNIKFPLLRLSEKASMCI